MSTPQEMSEGFGMAPGDYTNPVAVNYPWRIWVNRSSWPTREDHVIYQEKEVKQSCVIFFVIYDICDIVKYI